MAIKVKVGRNQCVSLVSSFVVYLMMEGRRLKEACGSFWAQLNCAKTCGCPSDSEGREGSW